MRKRILKAFSLLEIMVVIGIALGLMVIAVPTFKYFREESELNNGTGEIINTLRLAQSRTVTSEAASRYGVYFDNATQPHKYVLFKGSSYALRDVSADEINILPRSVEISAISLGGGEEVVFERIDGETPQAGSLSLGLITDISKTRTIYVENSGHVGLDDIGLPPTEGRISDSRHTHFGLSWSVQNTTQLKFYFPDAPQTEITDTTGYFNADKSSFDWKGEFNVGGNNQVFRIHTHNLDAFSTSLCVHRDRNNGNNNQEVIIYFIDGGVEKDVAHYLADTSDTVEKGSYVNTLDRQ